MPWNKQFIKAEIKKVKDVYVATITYSYFGLYHFSVVDYFESDDLAKLFILKERCGGHLVISDGY